MDARTVLMNRCLELLDEIMQTEPTAYYGTPPKSIIITVGHFDGNTCEPLSVKYEETYMYDGSLKPALPNIQWIKEPVSRMYYYQGRACVGKWGDKAYIAYYVGPLYARCFEYTISDERVPRLINEKIIWVS